MRLHLTPEQEAKLQELSNRTGQDAEHLLGEAVDNLYAYDAYFRQKVQAGLDQLNRGAFVEDGLVHNWLNSKK